MTKKIEAIPVVFIEKHITMKLVKVLERAGVYAGGAHLRAARGGDGVKRIVFVACIKEK